MERTITWVWHRGTGAAEGYEYHLHREESRTATLSVPPPWSAVERPKRARAWLPLDARHLLLVGDGPVPQSAIALLSVAEDGWEHIAGIRLPLLIDGPLSFDFPELPTALPAEGESGGKP